MDNAKWLEERRKGIGGSDVAAILGLSPWKTPYQLYLEKRNEVEPFKGNDACTWGTMMEPVIRQWYSDTTGRIVKVPEGIIYNEKHPFMFANLDGFTDDRRVVEIKTARSGQKWGEPGTDEIPDYYMCQVQHYLVVTGFEVCDVPVSIGGALPVLYEVEADPELQEMLIEEEASFWQRIQNDNPPDPITCADAIQRFGKSQATGIVEADGMVAEDVAKLKRIRGEIKLLEDQEDEIKGGIIKLLGDRGDTLKHGDSTLITYKLSKGRELFDSKAFQKEYPEIYKQFIKQGEPSRRFLVK